MVRKRKLKHLWALLLAPLIVAADSPSETDQALAALRAEDLRVASVAYRLAVGNRDLCPAQSPWFGLVVHGLRQYVPEYRADVARFFALGAGPAIEAIVPGGAAERAGARAGDRIVAINGVPTDQRMPGPNDPADYRGTEQVLAQLDGAGRSRAVRLTVERAEGVASYDVAPDQGCRSQVQLETSRSLNAGADGTMISIGLDAAAAADSDDELAVSIAHELAHNILQHRVRLDREDMAKGRTRWKARDVRKAEDEADLLGLYLMVRAGFDIGVAPAYWERLSRMQGRRSDATHAGSKERRAINQRTVDDIRARQARGEALTPPLPIPGRTPL